MKFIKFIFIIIILLAPSFYFGYNEKPIEMGIILAASCLALFFTNIEKFKSIKTSFFEASINDLKNEIKTVENKIDKIDSVLQEASNLNEELSKEYPTIPKINFAEDPIILLKNIDKISNEVKYTVEYIYNTSLDREKQLIDTLKTKEVDITLLDNDSYLNNQLFECYNIFMNNALVNLNIYTKQIMYYILNENMKKEPHNKEIKTNIYEVRNELIRLSNTHSLTD